MQWTAPYARCRSRHDVIEVNHADKNTFDMELIKEREHGPQSERGERLQVLKAAMLESGLTANTWRR